MPRAMPSRRRTLQRRAGAAGIVLAAAGIVVFTGLAAGSDRGRVWAFGWSGAVVIAAGTLFALVHTLDRERIETAAALERVYTAMRAISASPALEPTLQAVANGATDAVGAAFTAILLREGDQTYLYALSGMTGQHVPFDVIAGSPVELVFRTGEIITMQKPNRDPRFDAWTEEMRPVLEAAGIECGIGVPLRVGDTIVGVLGSMFDKPRMTTRANVRMLMLYAEQAALVLVRAQAYERERESAQRLADADRLKSEFLALVSHELRTPLTSIKGFIDTLLLRWPTLDERTRLELLERAARNTDELAHLIERLLEFSRIEAGEIALEPAIEQVRRLVRDAITAVEPALGGREVTITIPDDLFVLVDRQVFSHVVTNLLTNAAKFSPERTPIAVRAGRVGPEVRLTVTDSGPGVPPEERGRIFERFYQSPGHGRRGAGLGLAIARACAEASGGRLSVADGPGPGATFEFALPEHVTGGDGLTGGEDTAKLDQPV